MLRLTLLLLSSPLAASLVLTHRASFPRAIAASRSRAVFAAEEAKIAELQESIEAAAARQDYAAAAELQQQLKQLQDAEVEAAVAAPESALTTTAEVVEGETRLLTAADVEEVGNLAEDEEWLGLGMEMAIVVRSAFRESVKKNVKEFTGSEDYKVGDLSKAADEKIKGEIAKLRGKDEYELGDLSLAMDALVKDEVCKMTGKDSYEAGDLSVEIDARVKVAAAKFAGKETYEAGDLTREISKRAKASAIEFTGRSDYSFGDVSRELNKRRAEWVTGYLGKEYAFGDLTTKLVSDFTGKDDYKFGDLTKTAVKNFTGKDEYEFGDISKKLGQMMFGNKDVKKKEK